MRQHDALRIARGTRRVANDETEQEGRLTITNIELRRTHRSSLLAIFVETLASADFSKSVYERTSMCVDDFNARTSSATSIT